MKPFLYVLQVRVGKLTNIGHICRCGTKGYPFMLVFNLKLDKIRCCCLKCLGYYANLRGGEGVCRSFFYRRQFYKSYTDMKQVGEILLILEIGKGV